MSACATERMQDGHTRRALLLTAAAGAGCLGRSSPVLEVHTELRGRPFYYHSRCCDWEGTTVTGFLPAVFEALGKAISAELRVEAAGPQTAIQCALTPTDSGGITLLNGFYTVVMPTDATPAVVLIPEPIDTPALRERLTDLTAAVPRQVEVPVGTPRAGDAVVTDWVTAYRWARRDKVRLVDAAGRHSGAFRPAIMPVGQAAVTLRVADPSLEDTLHAGMMQLSRRGQLDAIRAEYFFASGRPRRL